MPLPSSRDGASFHTHYLRADLRTETRILHLLWHTKTPERDEKLQLNYGKNVKFATGIKIITDARSYLGIKLATPVGSTMSPTITQHPPKHSSMSIVVIGTQQIQGVLFWKTCIGLV